MKVGVSNRHIVEVCKDINVRGSLLKYKTKPIPKLIKILKKIKIIPTNIGNLARLIITKII